MLSKPQIDALERSLITLFAVHCLVGHDSPIAICSCRQAKDYRILEGLLSDYVDIVPTAKKRRDKRQADPLPGEIGRK